MGDGYNYHDAHIFICTFFYI